MTRSRKRKAIQTVSMRKQPLQSRSQERVDKIITTAEDLIVRKSLSQLSIREVARESGTNIATFYQYFPNRSALLRKIVEKYQAMLRGILRNAFRKADPSDLTSAFEYVFERLLNFYIEYPVTREIWPGTDTDHAVRDVNIADNLINIQLAVDFVRPVLPNVSQERVGLTMTWILATTAPVLRYASAMPEKVRRGFLEIHLKQCVAHLQDLRNENQDN